jgi:hypothetical protein
MLRSPSYFKIRMSKKRIIIKAFFYADVKILVASHIAKKKTMAC